VLWRREARQSCRVCQGTAVSLFSFVALAHHATTHATQVMEKNFTEMTEWYGKLHGSFEILHGDFLEEQFNEHIRTADVIFVNNFAFGTQLNQELKERFSNCKEGCKIVSSLNFSPLTFTITNRNLSDIGTILTVRKVTCTGEGVSWTSRPFDYYIQTVDRSKLELFFSTKNAMPMPVSEHPAEKEKETEQAKKKDATRRTRMRGEAAADYGEEEGEGEDGEEDEEDAPKARRHAGELSRKHLAVPRIQTKEEVSGGGCCVCVCVCVCV
jgi:H3 lysine-79-specific histone-lysine N-methyltransferase